MLFAYLFFTNVRQSHPILLVALFAAGIFGSQALAGLAQFYGLWGLDTSHDLWAIGPLLEVMVLIYLTKQGREDFPVLLTLTATQYLPDALVSFRACGGYCDHLRHQQP
ncbi:MAG TPA: hypothetical protein VFA07_04555, partial [Chthonomonadaceae bacterium]|nr:hypothetical protein [Chthonomonadaceae bacterium]